MTAPSESFGFAGLELPPAVLGQLGDLLEIGIVMTDADLVVQLWGGWMARASGLSAAEVVGRPLLEVFPEIAGTACEAAFRRALAGESIVFAQRFHRYLLPLPAPPGFDEFERMQQSARIAPILRNGAIRGAMAVVHDVTDRVAQEQELRAALEVAQAANSAKADFLASMSHELRTPLAAIVGYADLLGGEMTGPLLDAQKEQISRIKSAAWHLLGIIEEILAFARVEAGKEEAELSDVDVALLVRESLMLVEPQAIVKRIALECNVPPTPVTARTDPGKLRQIVVNIVGNAVKFTETGSVTVELASSPDELLLRIRDTGPGIPAADLERIFEPFTQLDGSRTRTKGGTGLGLPVSQRLAQLLGGELSVESVPGEGSTFTLRLPQAGPRPA